MKSKILMILVIGIFLFSIAPVMATDDLGTFKQNTNVRVVQICNDATFITLSSIAFPNSTTGINDTNMTFSGSGEYFHNFNSTDAIGRYEVRGISDGCENTFATFFTVTPSGFINTLGVYIVFLIILGGIIILGFKSEDAWYIIVGGMGFIMLGIYSINYGVVGFRDNFMTWGIGLFEIAIGAILSIQAGIQKIYYD